MHAQNVYKQKEQSRNKTISQSFTSLQKNRNSTLIFEDKRSKETAQFKLIKMLGSKTNSPIQRLIVGVEDISLEEEYKKDSGWIGAKTMGVALFRAGEEQDVIEFHELAGYKKLKKNENIYFVGHGSKNKWSDKDPNAVAEATGLMLPDGYTGNIVSLSCQSGLESREGAEDASIDVFAKKLKVDNIFIIGASGNTLHHPSLPTTVRTVIPKYYNSDVLPKIREMQPPVDEAWRKTRNEIIASEEYVKAPYADKLKMLAHAAEKISKKFYLDLVAWADKGGFLYPEGHAYRAQKSGSGH